MNKSSIEKIVENALRSVSQLFPQKNYLYFPLLSAAFIWAIRRKREWIKQILAWRVWPDPDFVKTKSDKFIIDFFMSNPDLRSAYSGEIENKNLISLRKAFDKLYPILSLEDPFLVALFNKELENNDYMKIVEEFEERVQRAREDIKNLGEKTKLMDGLRSFADEMVSLSGDLLSQTKIVRIIEEVVRNHIAKSKEND